MLTVVIYRKKNYYKKFKRIEETYKQILIHFFFTFSFFLIKLERIVFNVELDQLSFVLFAFPVIFYMPRSSFLMSSSLASSTVDPFLVKLPILSHQRSSTYRPNLTPWKIPRLFFINKINLFLRFPKSVTVRADKVILPFKSFLF